MIKKDELREESSCLNRAEDNDMIFVLIPKDEAAAATIRFWAYQRIQLKKNYRNDRQIQEALHSADVMEAQFKEKQK